MTEFFESVGMVATSSSLRLASIVLGFEIVELWLRDDTTLKFRCIYVYADRDTHEKHPDLITGHFPNHAKEHKLSPKLCQDAFEAEERFVWNILPVDSFEKALTDNLSGKPEKACTYKDVHVPVKTEIAFLLDSADTGSAQIYLVCLGVKEIAFDPTKLKFLRGLGYTIYIAAFDIDGADRETGGRAADGRDEEDGKAADDELDLQHAHETNIEAAASNDGSVNGEVSQKINNLLTGPNNDDGTNEDEEERSSLSLSKKEMTQFVYPIVNIPLARAASAALKDDFSLDDFSDVQHIADGSNANIFLCTYKMEKIVIKMIKVDVEYDPVAVEEFELEKAMLSRIDHPTIVSILGSGLAPRRFVMLEYLGGGSLNTLLNDNLAKPGLAQKLFRKPTFSYVDLLQAAKDMAEALYYLHFKCHSGATIVHRGK